MPANLIVGESPKDRDEVVLLARRYRVKKSDRTGTVWLQIFWTIVEGQGVGSTVEQNLWLSKPGQEFFQAVEWQQKFFDAMNLITGEPISRYPVGPEDEDMPELQAIPGQFARGVIRFESGQGQYRDKWSVSYLTKHVESGDVSPVSLDVDEDEDEII